MESWKKAYTYLKYEIQQSPMSIVSLAISLFIVLGMLAINLDSLDLYNRMEAMGFYDLIFLVSFTFLPMWISVSKFAPGQKGKNGTEAAPSVVLLLHLPVKRDTISKSRILAHIIRAYPLLIMLLLMIYVTNSPIRDAMPPLTYLVFCIIWLAFALYGGGMMLTADFIASGMTVFNVIVGVITAIASIAIVYSTFNFFSDVGIVYATVAAARNLPIISVLASIILAATGLHYIHKYNIKLMKKNDYL